MFDAKDHIFIVGIVFLATLGCFTAISMVGADGATVLSDILFALAGGVTGVAVQKQLGGK